MALCKINICSGSACIMVNSVFQLQLEDKVRDCILKNKVDRLNLFLSNIREGSYKTGKEDFRAILRKNDGTGTSIFLGMKDCLEQNILHITMKNAKNFEFLCDQIPSNTLAELIKQKDNSGDNVLHQLILFSRNEALNVLQDRVKKDPVIKKAFQLAENEPNKQGLTVKSHRKQLHILGQMYPLIDLLYKKSVELGAKANTNELYKEPESTMTELCRYIYENFETFRNKPLIQDSLEQFYDGVSGEIEMASPCLESLRDCKQILADIVNFIANLSVHILSLGTAYLVTQQFCMFSVLNSKNELISRLEKNIENINTSCGSITVN